MFFRDGEQIDFLALNEHYNFEFQQVTNLGKTKTVKLVGIELYVPQKSNMFETCPVCSDAYNLPNSDQKSKYKPLFSSHRVTHSWWNAHMTRTIEQDSLGLVYSDLITVNTSD